MTVVILGAGVDATDGIGMPLTNEIIPQINEFINTEEEKKLIMNCVVGYRTYVFILTNLSKIQ